MKKNILNGFLCKFGIHNKKTQVFTIDSEDELGIIEKLDCLCFCSKCGKVFHHMIWEWNGKEMIEIK